MRLHFFLLVLLLSVAVPLRAQDGNEPITATDLFNIRQLGDVAVSPDGRYVVYTVRQAFSEGEGTEARYGYRTHLWLAETGGREAPRPLTRGDNSASQPAWHPDGDRIAFVRTVEGKGQVFILPLDGGEAWQLTHAAAAASQPAFSPDGSLLLYASSLSEKEVRETGEPGPSWPLERPGRRPDDTSGATPNPDGSVAEVRAWLDANARDADPRVLNRLDLQGENDLEPGLSYRYLYVIAPTDSAVARPITRGFVSFGGGAWLGNGRQVVVSGNTQTAQHPDRERQSNLYLADVETGRLDAFLSIPGRRVFAPTPAPDGAHVAFLSTDLDDQGFAQTELGLYATTGRSTPEMLTSEFDRSVGNPRWSPEGRFLYFTAASEGGVPLYRIAPFGAGLEAAGDTLPGDTLTLSLPEPPALPDAAATAESLQADSAEAEGPIIEQLTPFSQGVGAFDATRSAVYYVVSQVENPFELYRAPLRFDRVAPLTDHNAVWLKTRRVSRPQPGSFTTPDSFTVPYWVMEPTFRRAGETYPLLLEMHGGPSAMWGPGENSMWHEFQLFAARGYGIVYSNPRGSGGYGYDFQRANFQNWGHGPASDVLAAADRAAALPWVDAEKQVITGGSYAGYLTAWIVGQDNRFKAAVAQRGVYELRTFFGEGNAWRLVPNHFGSYPWDSTRVSYGTARQVRADTTVLRRLDRETLRALDTMGLPPARLDSLGVLVVRNSEAPRDSLLESLRLDDAAVVRLQRLAADTIQARALGLESLSTTHLAALLDARVVAVRDTVTISDLLALESPLSYVHRIETPLLIIHGDADLRTGVIQSEMLYKSLKALGKNVEYVRYPDAGHELSRSGNPKQRLDRLLRIYEFMERFVR